MDLVHSSGVLVVQHLQSNYREYHGFLNFVSAVGDPWNIFSLYFPFWFHLSHTVGTKMIWVAVIGDWLNLIFKWLLSGHRPYWWVQETDFYHNASQPHLEQFHITCETGPGSPSGHAMGSSCVWFCLWAAFWIIQMGVCISRVFIATHFPHQVILGLFAGVLVAEAFNRFPPVDNASLKVYLQTGLLLLSSAVGLYLLLASLGADPLWSLAKARRWCANPAWLRLDTTPFAGLARNLGALFGLGLALNSQLFIQSCRGKNGAEIRFKLTCVTATLTSLQLCNLVRTPAHTELLFYVLAFCKSASVPLCVVAVIPYCIHLLIGDEERKLV